MSPHSIFHASYESRNFSFDAVGLTENDALISLRTAITFHEQQYRLESGWYSDEDFVVREMKLGVPYRDGGELKC
jgi:hypothetical protein